MYCSKCGNLMAHGGRFCSTCGHPYDKSARKKGKRWIIFLLLPLLIVGLYEGFHFYKDHLYILAEQQLNVLMPSTLAEVSAKKEDSTATEELVAPIEGILQALQSSNLEKGYQDFTSSQFKEETPFEKFKNFVVTYPTLLKNRFHDYKEHYVEGDMGVATVMINPEEEEPLLMQYYLVKENGKWKIQSIRIRTISPKDIQENANNGSAIIEIAQQQLKALRQNDINKAYDFLSDDLKKEIPFDTFQKFININPTFTRHQSVNILEPDAEKNEGFLKARLQKGNETMEVEYAFQKMDGQWKVTGMQILSTSNENKEGSSFKTRDLITVIQSFLSALRSRDFDKAYALTSSQFQEENSQNAFEEFIKKHPEFVQSKDSSFEKLIFNNNIATMTGEIIHSDTIALPVEFDLIQQDGNWKILHIFTHPSINRNLEKNVPSPSTEKENPRIEFPKAIFGTKIDEDGKVEDNGTTFKKEIGDIYVNLYIKNGAAGQKINLLLRHVESGSSIPILNSTLEEDNDSIITLIFSPLRMGGQGEITNYELRQMERKALLEHLLSDWSKR